MLDPLFLILGCGSIGKRHTRNLQQLGVSRLLAFDVREDRRRDIHEQLKVPVADDLEAAFAERPSVVFVCSPTSLHLDHSVRAARHGCHLFVEKPLAATLEGVDALAEEVDRRQLKTLVGCNFRFHPGLQRVHDLVGSGVIGRIVSGRASFGQYLPDWHPWEDYRTTYSARASVGGGVLLDRIHELDYLCWLLGDCCSVMAMMGHVSDLEIDTEDVADLLLRFRSGAIGTVHLDYVNRSSECRLELTGVEGTITWSLQKAGVRWYTASDRQWHAQEWPQYDLNEMYLHQLQHFLHVLEGRTASVNDIHSASRVLSVALAARESANAGRSVQP